MKNCPRCGYEPKNFLCAAEVGVAWARSFARQCAIKVHKKGELCRNHIGKNVKLWEAHADKKNPRRKAEPSAV